MNQAQQAQDRDRDRARAKDRARNQGGQQGQQHNGQQRRDYAGESDQSDSEQPVVEQRPIPIAAGAPDDDAA